jgi:hypothetical protein
MQTRKQTPTTSRLGTDSNGNSPCDSFAFNPERYLGDTLTCAESSKLPNAMDRDHWAFGAGCVPVYFFNPHRPYPSIHIYPSSAITGFSSASLSDFFAPQPPHLSGYPRRRTRAMARDLAVAVGV